MVVMDVLDYLQVRYHWGGEFINDGKVLYYCGGSEAISFIELDKISLPGIMDHLRCHCNVGEGVLLHWLFPGKELKDGLRVLVDDNSCLYMSECIVDGGVVDIYVEGPAVQELSDDTGLHESHFQNELADMEDGENVDIQTCDEMQIELIPIRSQTEKQIQNMEEYYRSPRKKGKEKTQLMWMRLTPAVTVTTFLVTSVHQRKMKKKQTS